MARQIQASHNAATGFSTGTKAAVLQEEGDAAAATTTVAAVATVTGGKSSRATVGATKKRTRKGLILDEFSRLVDELVGMLGLSEADGVEKDGKRKADTADGVEGVVKDAGCDAAVTVSPCPGLGADTAAVTPADNVAAEMAGGTAALLRPPLPLTAPFSPPPPPPPSSSSSVPPPPPPSSSSSSSVHASAANDAEAATGILPPVQAFCCGGKSRVAPCSAAVPTEPATARARIGASCCASAAVTNVGGTKIDRKCNTRRRKTKDGKKKEEEKEEELVEISIDTNAAFAQLSREKGYVDIKVRFSAAFLYLVPCHLAYKAIWAICTKRLTVSLCSYICAEMYVLDTLGSDVLGRVATDTACIGIPGKRLGSGFKQNSDSTGSQGSKGSSSSSSCRRQAQCCICQRCRRWRS
jgi:hypothetical protein